MHLTSYGNRSVASFLIACTFVLLIFSAPLNAHAFFPFGGQIGFLFKCENPVIYTTLGPPRGGSFVWSPGTRTYLYGPPAHTGQWLLGAAGPISICIISIDPPAFFFGLNMIIEGSSV